MTPVTSPVSFSTTAPTASRSSLHRWLSSQQRHPGLHEPDMSRTPVRLLPRSPSATPTNGFPPGVDAELRQNRVTLKIEVPYTDHSHIIGRGGRSIKHVMTSTQCHVHFPDSNRFSVTEKCNQVSIAGSPQDVENARQQIRRLMPLIFMFEIPIPLEIHHLSSSTVIQRVQQEYGVQVYIKGHGRQSCCALVKGNSWDLHNIKEAIYALMHTYQMDPSSVVVYVSLEISPQHHATVLGQGRANARLIMGHTDTYIAWPDLSDQNLPVIRRSHINIGGDMNNIHRARDMLLGCLPISLLVELPGGHQMDVAVIQQVMVKYRVMVSTKPKPRSLTGSRILQIRGVERDIQDCFSARRELMKLTQEVPVVVDIPASYKLPTLPPPATGITRHHPLLWRPVAPTVEQHHGRDSVFGHAPQQLRLPLGYPNVFSADPRARSPPMPLMSVPTTLSPTPNGRSSQSSSPLTPTLAHLPPKQAIRAILATHGRQTSADSGLGSPEQWQYAAQLTPSPELPMKHPPLSPLSPSHNMVPISSANDAVSVATSLLSAMDLNNHQPAHSKSELEKLLKNNGLERYAGLLSAHGIDLPKFLSFTEEDLSNMGVNVVWALRRMLDLIQETKRARESQAAPVFSGSAAVGAERRSSSSSASNY